MMSRYTTTFAKLRQAKQGAFVPFVVIGDPNPELSEQIIETLIQSGADALELGIPFSDPVADGPTIQDADSRALQAKTTPAICFDIIQRVRQRHPDLPIGLLLYANLVFTHTPDVFYQKAALAGVDSVLIADVPVEMSQPFRSAAAKAGIETIFIAPPNADDATLQQVAELSQGYVYLLSRAGVTGSETKAEMPVQHLITALKEFKAPPTLLGFGISEPAQVSAAIASGADGAISGSAIVKIIATHQHEPAQLLTTLEQFIRAMKAATYIA
jgi:tryptophan synthase alpha chain